MYVHGAMEAGLAFVSCGLFCIRTQFVVRSCMGGKQREVIHQAYASAVLMWATLAWTFGHHRSVRAYDMMHAELTRSLRCEEESLPETRGGGAFAPEDNAAGAVPQPPCKRKWRCEVMRHLRCRSQAIPGGSPTQMLACSSGETRHTRL